MKKSSIIIALLFLYSSFCVKAQEKIESGKIFYIQSALSYGVNNGACWDIRGKNISFNNGQNLIVWELSDKLPDRKFKIIFEKEEGGKYWYSIAPEYTNGHGRIDVVGGGSADGTNVNIWSSNGTDAQLFSFMHLGDGRFKIYNKNGKILCLDQQNAGNGTNIHLWSDHNATSTQWYLIDVNANTKYLPKPFEIAYSNTGSGFIGTTFCNLELGQQIDFAQVNFDKNGKVQNSVIKLKRQVNAKNAYSADPWSGELKPINGIAEDYMYDFWLFFNGKRFGPYDKIKTIDHGYLVMFSLNEALSDDGMFITFSGLKGDRYYPVIFSHEEESYKYPQLGPVFAKNIDCKRSGYAINPHNRGYNFYENFSKTNFVWDKISNLVYSDLSGLPLYYASQKDAPNFVYLNNQKISGPLKMVYDFGFVKGHDYYYYYALDENKNVICANGDFISISNDPDKRYKVYCKNKKLIVRASKYNKETRISKINYIEYDFVTKKSLKFGNLERHGVASVNLEKFDKFYDYGFNGEGIPTIIGEGGQIVATFPNQKKYQIDHISKDHKGDLLVTFRNNDNDEKYRFITDIKGNVLIKSNKVVSLKINKTNDAVIFYSNKTVNENIPNSPNEYVVKVDNQETKFSLNGNVEFFYNKAAKILYTIHHDYKDKCVYLYINGKKVEQSWPSMDVETFCYSPNGDYAFLYSIESMRRSYEQSTYKDYIWRLCFNGNNLEGYFGRPQYSVLDGGIVVPKQENQKIIGVKL